MHQKQPPANVARARPGAGACGVLPRRAAASRDRERGRRRRQARQDQWLSGHVSLSHRDYRSPGQGCSRRALCLRGDGAAGAGAGPRGRRRRPLRVGRLRPDVPALPRREWGFPVADDTRLFEKINLEGFQSGLSWLTILRKRENFRAAFARLRLPRGGALRPAQRAAPPARRRHRPPPGQDRVHDQQRAARARPWPPSSARSRRYFWRWAPGRRAAAAPPDPRRAGRHPEHRRVAGAQPRPEEARVDVRRARRPSMPSCRRWGWSTTTSRGARCAGPPRPRARASPCPHEGPRALTPPAPAPARPAPAPAGPCPPGSSRRAWPSSTRAPQRRVLHQAVAPARPRLLGLLVAEQDAGAVERLRHRARVVGHHGQTEGHRLEQRHAETLVLGHRDVRGSRPRNRRAARRPRPGR